MLLSSALCAVLFVPIAEDKKDAKAADLIVGKWVTRLATNNGDIELILEFAKDGTYTRSYGPRTFKGKYKLVDENNLEMESPTPEGKTVTSKEKVTVTRDKLTLETESGAKKSILEFKRAPK